jgi:hypothetical protein
MDEYETLLRANRYEDEIATAVGDIDLLPPFMFDDGTVEDTRTREQLLRELEDVNKYTLFPHSQTERVHHPRLFGQKLITGPACTRPSDNE